MRAPPVRVCHATPIVTRFCAAGLTKQILLDRDEKIGSAAEYLAARAVLGRTCYGGARMFRTAMALLCHSSDAVYRRDSFIFLFLLARGHLAATVLGQ